MADPISPQFRQVMNRIARQIDQELNGKPKCCRMPSVGFVLLTAEFGKIDGGRVNYISNGDRASMIAMLREYLARLEGRYVDAPEGPRQ